MKWYLAFIIGSFGGFISFLITFRKNYLRDLTIFPLHINYRAMLWGIFISMLLGGVYTLYVVEATTTKQAFLCGLTAEGFFLTYIKKNNMEETNNV